MGTQPCDPTAWTTSPRLQAPSWRMVPRHVTCLPEPRPPLADSALKLPSNDLPREVPMSWTCLDCWDQPYLKPASLLALGAGWAPPPPCGPFLLPLSPDLQSALGLMSLAGSCLTMGRTRAQHPPVLSASTQKAAAMGSVFSHCCLLGQRPRDLLCSHPQWKGPSWGRWCRGCHSHRLRLSLSQTHGAPQCVHSVAGGYNDAGGAGTANTGMVLPSLWDPAIWRRKPRPPAPRQPHTPPVQPRPLPDLAQLSLSKGRIVKGGGAGKWPLAPQPYPQPLSWGPGAPPLQTAAGCGPSRPGGPFPAQGPGAQGPRVGRGTRLSWSVLARPDWDLWGLPDACRPSTHMALPHQWGWGGATSG